MKASSQPIDYDTQMAKLQKEQTAAQEAYYKRIPKGHNYPGNSKRFQQELQHWKDEGTAMMNHYSNAMDNLIMSNAHNKVPSNAPVNIPSDISFSDADGGTVSRFANGGYVPSYADGTVTPEDALVQNTAANDPQTLMQMMMQNNMDPELKKRLVDAATSEMRTKALSGIPMMAGVYDKDETPERTRGHYVGAATNPYAGEVTDAMMGNMPTMAPYQSEANANLSRLMQSANMTSNAGARNMAMANSMMAHNAMMNSAQRQVDAMRMSQSAQYGQTMAGIGSGDQQAINAASQFNAQEGARVDDLNARARAKARDNEYNNRVKHLFGAERAGALKSDGDWKDLWGSIKDKAKGWGKEAAELAQSPSLKGIVEKVVGKHATNEEIDDAYYMAVLGGYEGSPEDFKKLMKEQEKNTKK